MTVVIKLTADQRDELMWMLRTRRDLLVDLIKEEKKKRHPGNAILTYKQSLNAVEDLMKALLNHTWLDPIYDPSSYRTITSDENGDAQ
jgi:hypothetical protein